MVQAIPLVRGLVALVDDEDYEHVSVYRWNPSSPKSAHGLIYAQRSPSKREGGPTTVYLHRVILGAPKGAQVDHINGNGLDNRRCNLRLATQSLNNANRTKGVRSRTGLRGVVRMHTSWRAEIKSTLRNVRGPCRRDQIAAAFDYDNIAASLFGEFAVLNFPCVERGK